MHTLGLILVFLACVAMGSCYCRYRKKRLHALRELVLALELMEGELKTNAQPLPELFLLLSRRTGDPASAFFEVLMNQLPAIGERSFPELWGQAAAETLTPLGREDMETLLQLGQVLGRYELSQQLNAVHICENTLRKSLNMAREAYPGEHRLGMGLGLSAGILFLIMWL